MKIWQSYAIHSPDHVLLFLFSFWDHGSVTALFLANKYFIANWDDVESEHCADHLKPSKSDWIFEVI